MQTSALHGHVRPGDAVAAVNGCPTPTALAFGTCLQDILAEDPSGYCVDLAALPAESGMGSAARAAMLRSVRVRAMRV